MDFNAYNMKMLAEETRNSQNQERYKDIMKAIIEAAQAGKNSINVKELTLQCARWLTQLDFAIYKKRLDNRWTTVDDGDWCGFEFYPPMYEVEDIYQIRW